MNLSPKNEGEYVPDIATRMPVSLEEAVKHINSKFPFIADSVQAYEEWGTGDETRRAAHITYALGARIEGEDTVKDLLNAWFICMLDAVTNSKRQRLYWRRKPEITVVHRDFPDGPGFAVEIHSRSAMV